jgi:hypothetical protein
VYEELKIKQRTGMGGVLLDGWFYQEEEKLGIRDEEKRSAEV